MTHQRKWYSLADKVWNPANLAMAAAAVLANQGAAGVDHQSCDQFAEHLGEELDRLGQAMREHRYRPPAGPPRLDTEAGDQETEAPRGACYPGPRGGRSHAANHGTHLGTDLQPGQLRFSTWA